MDNTEDFFKNYRGRYSQYWVERWGLIPELPTSFDNANSMYEFMAWLQRAFKNLLDDFQQLESESEDFKNALIDLLEYLIPELIRRYSDSAEFRALFIVLLQDILAGEERNWVKDLLKELIEVDMREWVEVYLKDLYGLELNKTNAQLAQIATDAKSVGIVGNGIIDDTQAFKNAVETEGITLNISNLKIKLTDAVRFAKGVTLLSNNKTQIILDGSEHHGIIFHRNINIVGQLEVFCNTNFNGHAVRMDNYDIYSGLWGSNVTDDSGYSVKTNITNLIIRRMDKPTVANENFVGLALVSDASLREKGNGDSGFFGAIFDKVNIVNIPTAIRLENIGAGTWINSNTFTNFIIDSPINAIIASSGTTLNKFENIVVQTSRYTLDIIKDSGRNIIDYSTWDTHNGINANDTGIQQGFTKFGSPSDVHRHLYSTHITIAENKYTKLGSLTLGNQLRQQYVRFRLSNAYAYAEFLLYWDGVKFTLVKVLHDSTGERFRNDFNIYYKIVRGSYVLYMYNTYVSSVGNIYNFTLLDGGNFLLDSAVGGVTFDTLTGLTKATEVIQDKYTDKHLIVSDGNFTFANGYSKGGLEPQVRKNNNVVNLTLNVRNDNGTFVTGTPVSLGTLPVGFRPKTSFISNCSLSVLEYNVDVIGYVFVGSSGNVQVSVKDENMKFAHINLSYIID